MYLYVDPALTSNFLGTWRRTDGCNEVRPKRGLPRLCCPPQNKQPTTSRVQCLSPEIATVSFPFIPSCRLSYLGPWWRYLLPRLYIPPHSLPHLITMWKPFVPPSLWRPSSCRTTPMELSTIHISSSSNQIPHET